MCNDTGSNLLTVFVSDLLALNFSTALHSSAIEGEMLIATADGQAAHPLVSVDMQILTSTLDELTPWFREQGVLKPDDAGATRLSGAMMRNHLFFATAPGNSHLYIAQKKAGLIRDLPW